MKAVIIIGLIFAVGAWGINTEKLLEHASEITRETIKLTQNGTANYTVVKYYNGSSCSNDPDYVVVAAAPTCTAVNCLSLPNVGTIDTECDSQPPSLKGYAAIESFSDSSCSNLLSGVYIQASGECIKIPNASRSMIATCSGGNAKISQCSDSNCQKCFSYPALHCLNKVNVVCL
jgi:hypothetical protein